MCKTEAKSHNEKLTSSFFDSSKTNCDQLMLYLFFIHDIFNYLFKLKILVYFAGPQSEANCNDRLVRYISSYCISFAASSHLPKEMPHRSGNGQEWSEIYCSYPLQVCVNPKPSGVNFFVRLTARFQEYDL